MYTVHDVWIALFRVRPELRSDSLFTRATQYPWPPSTSGFLDGFVNMALGVNFNAWKVSKSKSYFIRQDN